MLFNSYEFIFLFLPLTLLGYYKVAQTGRENAILWLVLASLFFYSWWNPYYLILILVSLFINFSFGNMLVRAHRARDGSRGIIWLSVGISINLGLLGYFKYANFFVDNVNFLFGADMYLSEIILPLAISFFTFQQITYLVDAHKGITREYKF
ncbi:MAG: MBOAT family protein, partial [Nitrosomonas sp.]|nr:MBOAT family protein [Nitrosomonas sp.]